MKDMIMDTDNDYDAYMDDVLRFECWYHSVIDDFANLIQANGYDKVMYDVKCAVNRMEKSE